ncbi:glycoside hydrolase family 92 protein, partial [Erysipelothrix rhusiopathiae]|nr:glycoside hydrolase family 92 protein [Erysipelothrix rhusiopathiae]
FGVYHDIQGLINLYGGAIPFSQKLDELVNQKPTFDVGSYGFENIKIIYLNQRSGLIYFKYKIHLKIWVFTS